MLERILVTNDDGIDAPGLAVAAEVAAQFAREVWVCAPASDCSGRSQQISLHEPLRLHAHGERRFAVTGSPADCAVMGIRHLMQANPPDLVLSGVNSGANHSREIGYSGTVGAALTSRLLGVPAVAASQSWLTRGNVPWDTTRAWLPRVLGPIIEGRLWPEEGIVNVNLPGVHADDITGIRTTRIGSRLSLDIHLDKRTDNREQDYFWLKFTREPLHDDPDTDVAALRAMAISVTPLGLDLTDHAARSKLSLTEWDTAAHSRTEAEA